MLLKKVCYGGLQVNSGHMYKIVAVGYCHAIIVIFKYAVLPQNLMNVVMFILQFCNHQLLISVPCITLMHINIAAFVLPWCVCMWTFISLFALYS